MRRILLALVFLCVPSVGFAQTRSVSPLLPSWRVNPVWMMGAGQVGPAVLTPKRVDAPIFTGQWTINGTLAAAGCVVQGGSPTTCTPTPSLGTAASVSGTMGLANGAGGGNVWTLASAATSAWTLTGSATAPPQGALFTFSNATGQMSTIADVVTGQVLISQGTNTVPIYSANPIISSVSSPAATNFMFGAAGTSVWGVQATTNHLFLSSDNTNDIGLGGSNRPRTGYFGTSVVVPTVNATTGYQLNGTPGVGFALAQAQPADQTARSSIGAFVMMGLGAAAAPCTVTPTSTGRIKFEINGDLVNNTTATTVTIQLAENTGTAPANNAAATGTVITKGKVIDGLTSDLTSAFHLVGTKTGLALNTAVWFDLQLQTSGANTGQPINVDCVAHEL